MATGIQSDAVMRMGLHDMSLSDKQVAEKFKKSLEDTHSYSWVQVNTIMYSFAGTEKQTRKIELQTTKAQAIWNYIKRIFDSRHAVVNINAAVEAALGSRDSYDVKELQKAYNKNVKLVIYVSCDLKNVYFDAVF